MEVKKFGGYDQKIFIDPINKDFICPICSLFVRHPKECIVCGTIFCESCLFQWLEHNPNNLCICPMRCKKSNGTEIIMKPVGKIIKNIINSLKVKCPNSDCGKVMTFEEYEEHERSCNLPKCMNEKCRKEQENLIIYKDPKGTEFKFCSEFCKFSFIFQQICATKIIKNKNLNDLNLEEDEKEAQEYTSKGSDEINNDINNKNNKAKNNENCARKLSHNSVKNKANNKSLKEKNDIKNNKDNAPAKGEGKFSSQKFKSNALNQFEKTSNGKRCCSPNNYNNNYNNTNNCEVPKNNISLRINENNKNNKNINDNSNNINNCNINNSNHNSSSSNNSNTLDNINNTTNANNKSSKLLEVSNNNNLEVQKKEYSSSISLPYNINNPQKTIENDSQNSGEPKKCANPINLLVNNPYIGKDIDLTDWFHNFVTTNLQENLHKSCEKRICNLKNMIRAITGNNSMVINDTYYDPGHTSFKWDKDRKGQGIQIYNNGDSLFLNENCYAFRSIVANEPFMEGVHYFEVIADKRTESELKIGVTKNPNFNYDTSFSDYSFGWAFYGVGQLRHSNNANGETYGKKFKKQGVLGVFLDMNKGILSFALDKEYFGIAYKSEELKHGPIYPAVSLLHVGGCTLQTGVSAQPYFFSDY